MNQYHTPQLCVALMTEQVFDYVCFGPVGIQEPNWHLVVFQPLQTDHSSLMCSGEGVDFYHHLAKGDVICHPQCLTDRWFDLNVWHCKQNV